MNKQLPLDFHLRDEATLERFIAGPNKELVSALELLAIAEQPSLLFIVGGTASGKTHLLQAASRSLESSLYMPLKEISQYSPDMFDGFATADLVCLDDVDCLARHDDMEVALFSLFNQMKEQGTSFVMSASNRPDQVGFGLKDLVSRLNAAVQYSLLELNEADKQQYLKKEASIRGLALSQEVIDWIFVHTARDMCSLVELMNMLDHASLAAQRRITIPFLKATIKG